MTKDDLSEIENMIGKSLGWVKYDSANDYEMSPFGGMWVEPDGKLGHDIIKLAQKIHALLSRTKATAYNEGVRFGRIDELKNLKVIRKKRGYYAKNLYKAFDYVDKRLAELGGSDG